MMKTSQPDNQVVLVSGLSGAGKSSALRQFEDMGWEIADNVPLLLLEPMIRQSADAGGLHLALGVDSRTRGFSQQEVLGLMTRLRDADHIKVRLLFLDCDEAVLQRRYTETRRRHPLAKDRPVADGIRQEKEQLFGLKEVADLRIDSTNMSLPDFKRLMTGHFKLHQTSRLSVTVQSFSYKFGVPREADLMFDVRFLHNPYYDLSLRPKTGQDAEVVAFIERDVAFDAFAAHVSDLLKLLLPRYAEEGKSYLTIAVGCTGGRHRSVCLAEKIHDLVVKNGYFANLVHRDLIKSGGN